MTRIKLHYGHNGYYLSESIDRAVLQHETFYLAITQSDIDITQANQLAKQIKVAAPDAMNIIIAAALPGVDIDYLQHIPNQLPVKPDCHYFHLQTQGTIWQHIIEQGRLAVFLPNELTEISLELNCLQTH